MQPGLSAEMQYSVAEHRQGLERPPPRVALRWGCLDLLLARAGPAQLLYVDSDAVVPLEVLQQLPHVHFFVASCYSEVCL